MIVPLAGGAIVLFDVLRITFDVGICAEARMVVVLDAIDVSELIVPA